MRRWLITGTGMGLALALTACSGSAAPQGEAPQDSTSAPATSTTPAAKTADPPTVFDTTAPVTLPAGALRANLAGQVVSRFTSLHERTAYIVDPVGLTAVDVLTGEQRWATKIEGAPADPDAQSGPMVNEAGPRPPAIDDKGAVVVAAVPTSEPGKGTTPGYQSLTVFAADTGTGDKTWEVKIRLPEEVSGGSGRGAVTKVVAVTGKAVVATYRNDESLTVALDPADGRTLWERKEYTANAVHGDIVLGADHAVAENSSMSQATALALATGEQRWVAAGRAGSVEAFPAHPAVAVVAATDYDSGDPSLYFLDAASGAELGKIAKNGFGNAAYGKCDYDGQSVLVCQSEGQVTGYDATTAKALWTLPDDATNRIAPSVTALWHGALYGRTDAGPVVLDAKTGQDRSAEPGMAPHWVSAYAGIGIDQKGAPKAYPVKE